MLRRQEKHTERDEAMLTTCSFNSELAREKMWSRIHLIPVLQAEEDRDLVRRHWAEKAREKELLGAETKVYNNDKYVTKIPRDLHGRVGKNMLTVAQVRSPHVRRHTQGHHKVEKPSETRSGSQRARKSCCIYCGIRGVFPHRQPSADDSIKCSFKI